MLDFPTYLVEHFFAGLWTMIWHFGLGIGFIILLGVGAYFAPTLKLKALCIALALVIGAFVIGEGVGVNLEKRHNEAQVAATNNFVDKTVKGTTTPKARAKPDPWNNKDN
jgi:hypothetical protein